MDAKADDALEDVFVESGTLYRGEPWRVYVRLTRPVNLSIKNTSKHISGTEMPSIAISLNRSETTDREISADQFVVYTATEVWLVCHGNSEAKFTISIVR
jgi:hypothetical protein